MQEKVLFFKTQYKIKYKSFTCIVQFVDWNLRQSRLGWTKSSTAMLYSGSYIVMVPVLTGAPSASSKNKTLFFFSWSCISYVSVLLAEN